MKMKRHGFFEGAAGTTTPDTPERRIALMNRHPTAFTVLVFALLGIYEGAIMCRIPILFECTIAQNNWTPFYEWRLASVFWTRVKVQ